MADRPYVGVASDATIANRPSVVLDTNAVLDVALHSQSWFVAKFGDHVIVVPPIVLAELATKTHAEAYSDSGGRTQETIRAARNSLVLLSSSGAPWPTAEAPRAFIGFPTMKFWSAISLQRQCLDGDCSSDWLTWTDRPNGRRDSNPAMADHQVLATAWGLREDGNSRVTLLTSDRALLHAAGRFGVPAIAVPRSNRYK